MTNAMNSTPSVIVTHLRGITHRTRKLYCIHTCEAQTHTFSQLQLHTILSDSDCQCLYMSCQDTLANVQWILALSAFFWLCF